VDGQFIILPNNFLIVLFKPKGFADFLIEIGAKFMAHG
jgi:hypothetical protein